jgi:hypothetical protein
MQLADVNILIGAFRDDGYEHERCREWLQSVVSQSAPLAVSTLILSAVIRVTTNRRFHPIPSSLEGVTKFADGLMALPNVTIVEPGPRHWPIFVDLLERTGKLGSSTTDAWFAALAIEWDCEWITFDRDFARYPGLRWRHP